MDELISPAFKPEHRFVKWSVPSTDGEPGRDYWSITQYFVSEGTLFIYISVVGAVTLGLLKNQFMYQ